MKPADISADFQSQTCDMNSNLCLAQAQYLFYKIAKDKNMKPSLLSQIAMQASVYFSAAHEKCQMAQPLRQYDNGAFGSKLGWFKNYFEAVSFFELGQVAYKEADDKGKGMGPCCGYLNKAMQCLDRGKAFAQQAGSNYASNYSAKLEEYTKLHQKALEENAKVYFEKVPGDNELNKPDPKTFVKLIDQK
jgi:hypothetical protein